MFESNLCNIIVSKKFPFYKQLDAMDCGPTCLLPLLSNAHTLSEYIDNIEANTSIPIGDAPLYAWHTPLIDIHSPLSSPPQPLK